MKKIILICLLLLLITSCNNNFETCMDYCADNNDCGIDPFDGKISCYQRNDSKQIQKQCYDECRVEK